MANETLVLGLKTLFPPDTASVICSWSWYSIPDSQRALEDSVITVISDLFINQLLMLKLVDKQLELEVY